MEAHLWVEQADGGCDRNGPQKSGRKDLMSNAVPIPNMRALPDVGVRPTIPALLAQAADRYGDDDFIVLPDRKISFRQAEAASRKLALRMIALGAGKGTRIAMIYPSSTELVVAFLAVARIGALSIFLSSTMKAAEIRASLRLGDAAILLAPNDILGHDMAELLEESVPGLRQSGPLLHLPDMPYLRRICLESPESSGWATPMWDAAPEPGINGALLEQIEREVYPADELLMIWTSGSTAMPKGVVHTHGAAVRKCAPNVGLGLRPSQPGRLLMAMPLFWVGGPQSLIGCLFSGAALLCQERFDPGEAIDLIVDGRADGIMGWHFMLDRLQSHPHWEKAANVKLEPPRTAPKSSRGAALNLGMTETFGRHMKGDNFDYRIVDPETGKLLPDGEEGEFRVRGLCLMARMYKREREEVFDKDGFYPTGDKGYLEEGNAFFTGRYSEVIKSSGANVSPTEVEAVIEQFPEVQNAVVFAVPNAARLQDVGAVICLNGGAAVTAEEVIARCRKQMSGFKVPRIVKIVASHEFPMLASGKPDRRAIRAMLVPQ